VRTIRALALLALASALSAAAQSGEAPCGAVRTTTLAPCAASTFGALDGAPIGASDLDADLQKRVAGVDAAVAEARRRALDAEIADVRLHLEAERRRSTFRDFWEREIFRKTPRPSDGDVNALFEKWKKWYPATTLADLRPRLEGVVRAKNRAKREEAVAASLKDRFPSVPGADPAAPDLAPDAVLATVGGRKITTASASTRLLAAGFAVRRDLYYAERGAVERTLHLRLIKAEADRRGVTVEALRRAEIDDKVVPPTADEISHAWEKEEGAGKRPTDEERRAVAADLRQERADELEDALDRTLRAARRVDVSVPEPAVPVLELDAAGGPSRGPSGAPVTVVEYADFECPHCAKAWLAAEEALRPYGDRVRYVYRNFPLPSHGHALKAAEAARAADAQGRFFPMAALMFRNQRALDGPSLKKYAAEAGCDPSRFAADLDGGRLTADVLLEARAGERAGVSGTPTFFVNGVWLKWESTDVPGIRAAVDAALAKASSAKASARE
jgi:protein-disulfide isomerase